jgi:hypothetical protein
MHLPFLSPVRTRVIGELVRLVELRVEVDLTTAMKLDSDDLLTKLIDEAIKFDFKLWEQLNWDHGSMIRLIKATEGCLDRWYQIDNRGLQLQYYSLPTPPENVDSVLSLLELLKCRYDQVLDHTTRVHFLDFSQQWVTKNFVEQCEDYYNTIKTEVIHIESNGDQWRFVLKRMVDFHATIDTFHKFAAAY